MSDDGLVQAARIIRGGIVDGLFYVAIAIAFAGCYGGLLASR